MRDLGAFIMTVMLQRATEREMILLCNVIRVWST